MLPFDKFYVLHCKRIKELCSISRREASRLVEIGLENGRVVIGPVILDVLIKIELVS